MEKLGQSLETTANLLDVLAPLDRYLHQKVYDYEYKGEYKDGKDTDMELIFGKMVNLKEQNM